MAKPLAYSRWRRLPGVHRITEQRLPDHRSEPQRLSLFVPGWVLDEAERLAHQSGCHSVQEYCETILQEVIEQKAAGAPKRAPAEPKFSGHLDLDEIASDLQEIAEWSASQPVLNHTGAEPTYRALAAPASKRESEMPPEPSSESREAIEVVLRHAGFSADSQFGLLPVLRRGEPISPPQAEELLRALMTLEQALREQSSIEPHTGLCASSAGV